MQRLSQPLALALALGALLLADPAAAHKAILFGYVESGELVIEGGFPGGRPCKGCQVRVLDAATGEQLARAATSDQGVCRIPLPEAAGHADQGLKLVLDAGEGHRAEWLVRAKEYLDQPAQAEAGDAAQADTEPDPAASSDAAGPRVPAGELRRVVDEALEAKLAPIRRAVLRDQGPSASDVVGGIGYLVGLAGVWAWARSRRESREERGR
jgi:nickel transport protein